MDSPFTIAMGVQLEEGSRWFDLHNNFDFVRFEHRCDERQVLLHWEKNDGDWVPADAPAKLRLRFIGVSNVAVRRRDADMPFSEDRCVAHVAFAPAKAYDFYDADFGDARCPDEHFSLRFMSGAGIKIWATKVELLTGMCE